MSVKMMGALVGVGTYWIVESLTGSWKAAAGAGAVAGAAFWLAWRG